MILRRHFLWVQNALGLWRRLDRENSVPCWYMQMPFECVCGCVSVSLCVGCFAFLFRQHSCNCVVSLLSPLGSLVVKYILSWGSLWGQKAGKLPWSLGKLLQGFSAVQARKKGQGQAVPATDRVEWRRKDRAGMESCGESSAEPDFVSSFYQWEGKMDLKAAGFAGRDHSLLRSPPAAAKPPVFPVH